MRYTAAPLFSGLLLSVLLITCVTTGEDSENLSTGELQKQVVFADSNLEKAVREALGKPSGSLTAEDVEKLEKLEAPNSSISALGGIENLTLLRELHLSRNNISDISPLASLTSLTVVDLSHNKIIDISPLADLMSLTNLDLQANRIKDISSLRDHTSLTSLNLNDNKKLREVAVLTKLPSIRKLWIGLLS